MYSQASTMHAEEQLSKHQSFTAPRTCMPRLSETAHLSLRLLLKELLHARQVLGCAKVPALSGLLSAPHQRSKRQQQTVRQLLIPAAEACATAAACAVSDSAVPAARSKDTLMLWAALVAAVLSGPQDLFLPSKLWSTCSRRPCQWQQPAHCPRCR